MISITLFGATKM